VSDIFRDPTEGATARRADLLRRRRDELVTMPHAIRRVYVARRARTAASATIALLGIALLAIATQPSWASFLARGMPGINPAVLCTLVIAMWLAGGFAYLAARALDEHRFAVAMSRLVMPSANVHDDLERLAHEHPDQAARDMAHRLEVRSAVLPVLAAGVLLPATAMYIGAAIDAGGWPAIATFEWMVAHHADKLVACGAIGAVLALAMTTRALRLPSVAPAAGALALSSAGLAAATSAWLVPFALIVGAVALVGRRLRIERDQLDTDDPAAGSEVFTLRGAVRQLRAIVAPIVARARQVRPIWVLVAGLLVIAGVTATKLVEVRGAPARVEVPAAAAEATPVLAPTAVPTTVGPTGSRMSVSPLSGGMIAIEIDLVDEQPFEIPAIAGLRIVPAMWLARLQVELREGASLEIAALGEHDTQTLSIGAPLTLGREACGIDIVPLSLRVQGAPGHYSLFLAPTLTPTDC